MSSALGSLRGISQAFILIVAALVFARGRPAPSSRDTGGAMASRGTATATPVPSAMACQVTVTAF